MHDVSNDCISGDERKAMSNVTIRPSVLADYYAMMGKPPQESVQSWTAIYDGEIAAIAGIKLKRNDMVFFSEMNPDRKYPAIAVFKGACAIVEEVRKLNVPVLSLGTCNSDRFLTALGFTRTGEAHGYGVYQL